MYNIFSIKRKKIELIGKKVFLRFPKMKDWSEWAELRQKSRKFLQPWEPSWPKNYLTKNFFRQFVDDTYLLVKNKTSYTFFIFHNKSNLLMGGINLTNLKEDNYKSITLGYWMGIDYAGKGYMKDSINSISDFCFNSLKLNRIEAACLSNNTASKLVLIKSGFIVEGYAKKYLKINGKLQDHILFAKIKKIDI